MEATNPVPATITPPPPLSGGIVPAGRSPSSPVRGRPTNITIPHRNAVTVGTISRTPIRLNSDAVNDPARPSLMQILIEGVALDPSLKRDPKSSSQLIVRIKFRNREVIRKLGQDRRSRDPCEYVVNFHSHKFDSLKVDVYQKNIRKSSSQGRSRIPISNMENWHSGTYNSQYTLYTAHPKDSAPQSTGTITLRFAFQPVVLPNEDEVTTDGDSDPATPDTAPVYSHSQSQASLAQRRNTFMEIGTVQTLSNALIEPNKSLDKTLMTALAVSKWRRRSVSGSQIPLEPGSAIPSSRPSSAIMPGTSTTNSGRASYMEEPSDNTRHGDRADGIGSGGAGGMSGASSTPPGNSGAVTEPPMKKKTIKLGELFRKRTVQSPDEVRGESVDMSEYSRESDNANNSNNSNREVPVPGDQPTPSDSIPTWNESQSDIEIDMSTAGSGNGAFIASDLKGKKKFRLVSKKTSASLSEIGALFHAALKHDYRVEKGMTFKALKLLTKWENSTEMPRTENFVRDPRSLDIALRMNMHCICTYGKIVIQLCGYGSLMGNLSSERRAAANTLGLKVDDILCWGFGKAEVNRPRFFISHDTKLDAVVIAIQGTIHLSQVFTDLQAEYFPLKHGSAHLGMLRSAEWIMTNHLGDIKEWIRKYKVDKLFCTGHSLGAGTATLLTILLADCMDEIRRDSERSDLVLHGYIMAPPPT
ncbi:hypothetical protein HDU76_005975, partial [Blyttiomyces sp. JEL0837]